MKCHMREITDTGNWFLESVDLYVLLYRIISTRVLWVNTWFINCHMLYIFLTSENDWSRCWFLKLSWLGGSFSTWSLFPLWIFREYVDWKLPVALDCFAGGLKGNACCCWLRKEWMGRLFERSPGGMNRVSKNYPWYSLPGVSLRIWFWGIRESATHTGRLPTILEGMARGWAWGVQLSGSRTEQRSRKGKTGWDVLWDPKEV